MRLRGIKKTEKFSSVYLFMEGSVEVEFIEASVGVVEKSFQLGLKLWVRWAQGQWNRAAKE